MPESMEQTAARAWEVSRLLHEAIEQVNRSLGRAEAALAEKLGQQVIARVPLTKDSFLVFADGRLFYANKTQRSPLLSTSKRIRMLACERLHDLWIATGGEPLV